MEYPPGEMFVDWSPLPESIRVDREGTASMVVVDYQPAVRYKVSGPTVEPVGTRECEYRHYRCELDRARGLVGGGFYCFRGLHIGYQDFRTGRWRVYIENWYAWDEATKTLGVWHLA